MSWSNLASTLATMCTHARYRNSLPQNKDYDIVQMPIKHVYTTEVLYEYFVSLFSVMYMVYS